MAAQLARVHGLRALRHGGSDTAATCAGAWIARPAPWRQRHASHGLMLAATPGLSADQLLENDCTNCGGRRPCAVGTRSLIALAGGWMNKTSLRRRERVTAAFAAASRP